MAFVHLSDSSPESMFLNSKLLAVFDSWILVRSLFLLGVMFDRGCVDAYCGGDIGMLSFSCCVPDLFPGFVKFFSRCAVAL